MKVIKAIIAWFLMVFCGMAGGQGKLGGKAPRRFGLPALAIGTGLSFGWRWQYLAFLLLVPVLVMGYGVDSQLGAFVGHIEWLIRLIYAMLLSIPFFFFGWRRGLFATILLVIAFQIHAGTIGHVSWFGAILLEDIIRYGTLASLILFNIQSSPKH